jgi:nucleoside-diphosphate-sugar epimerase
VRFLVTGVTGFLGWRSATVLAERGHDVIGLARPGGAARAHTTGSDLAIQHVDAGDPAARDLVRGRDVVLHFAGVPDPARAREDPARAVRENAGTTANLLDGCLEHGAALIYPSTVRAALEPPPDAYGLSKRLGEEACRHHEARSAIARLTSVFGPGQVAWEGATGAIAAFARRALEDRPIVIPGDPERVRDFVYVDDVVAALEAIAGQGLWGETLTLASGRPTPLLRAARLARDASGCGVPIETPGGELPPGEGAGYPAEGDLARLGLTVRPIEDAVVSYVEWLRRHPAAQGRS